ncbi:hypothetical protein BHK69_01010 [Bosea vaviloviae]|uniref:Uncharacterized protein n=1 Tax=Bosea vaviloviae TaxID=1526658 RepID=A0A1D7TVW2_9HYPH|nr:hypothetical protein BHK69_01010 [Bosea vaviloviae]
MRAAPSSEIHRISPEEILNGNLHSWHTNLAPNLPSKHIQLRVAKSIDQPTAFTVGDVFEIDGIGFSEH